MEEDLKTLSNLGPVFYIHGNDPQVLNDALNKIPCDACSLVIGQKSYLNYAIAKTLVHKSLTVSAKAVSLIFEESTLINIDKKHLVDAVRAIPGSITTLYLIRDSLEVLPSETLNEVFGAIPTNISKLCFIYNFSDAKNLTKLSDAVACLPGNVRSVDLYHYDLHHNSIDDIVCFLKSIPQHVNSLDLRDCHLHMFQENELVKIFKNIPDNIVSLNLSKNGFDSISPNRIALAFEALPRTIKNLDLSGNFFLETWAVKDFIGILKVIPNVNSLNLSKNSLYKAYRDELLANIMENIPSNVKTLNLSSNKFSLIAQDWMDSDIDDESILNAPNLESQLGTAFSKIPSNVNSLILKSNHLGSSRDEARINLAEALSALPSNITLLDLSNNCLDELEEEDIAEIFEAIPSSITTLLLKGNKLADAFMNADAIINNIPPLITCLDFSDNDLGWRGGIFKNPDDIVIEDTFASIPSTVTSLSLKDNYLYDIEAEKFALILNSIPSHVTSLDLSYNYLSYGALTPLISCTGWPSIDLIGNSFCSEEEKKKNNLIYILSNIPTSITSLDLSGNQLGLFSGESLNRIFRAIPASITCLTLKDNFLFKRTGVELAQAFSALPAFITSLDISDNGLGSKSNIEIYQAIMAIHSTIKNPSSARMNLYLTNNNFFDKELRSFEERDDLLYRLRISKMYSPANISNMTLAFNGEADFQRSLAPFISLCRQKKGFSEDLIVFLLSFLVKNMDAPDQKRLGNEMSQLVSRSRTQSSAESKEMVKNNNPIILSQYRLKPHIGITNSSEEHAVKRQKT